MMTTTKLFWTSVLISSAFSEGVTAGKSAITCCKSIDIDDYNKENIVGPLAAFGKEPACVGILGLCKVPTIKSGCPSECAKAAAATSPCKEYLKKEFKDVAADVCPFFDPTSKLLVLGFAAAPARACSSMHSCRLAAEASGGKLCMKQCADLKKKCEEKKSVPGLVCSKTDAKPKGTTVKPKAPVVTKPKGPVVTKPKGPAVTKPVAPAVTKPVAPVVTKPKGPVLTKPKGPVVTKKPVGGSYCTFGPDKTCYKTGWPACCTTSVVACPAKRPGCEIKAPVVTKPKAPVFTKPKGPVFTKPKGPVFTKPKGPVITKPSIPAACSKKTDAAVRLICAKAYAQGIATVPLKDGVASLDRTISTKFNSPATVIKDVCGKGEEYYIPASKDFDFTSSTKIVDTTRTGAVGEPSYSFRCDAATDLYTLIFFDSFSAPVKNSLGYAHNLRVNMGCNAAKMFDPKKPGVILMPMYTPPANPGANPNVYQFYLFKQSKAVPLVKNKLAGFDGAAISAMGFPVDPTTGKPKAITLDLEKVLLAKLRPYLVPGGPVARNWQLVETSPVSAAMMKSFGMDMGQCMPPARALYAKYAKKADVTPKKPEGPRSGLRLKSDSASIELGSDIKIERIGDKKLAVRANVVTAGSLSAEDIYIGGMNIKDYIVKILKELL